MRATELNQAIDTTTLAMDGSRHGAHRSVQQAGFKRWKVKRELFRCVIALVLAGCGAAQEASPAHEGAPATARKRVLVDGKAIPANQVIVKDGVVYADAGFLARTLGAAVQSGDGGVIVQTEKPSCDSEKVAEGERFSEQFRSDVAGVAEEIESLRAAVSNKEMASLGPRFDAIERKLNGSTAHVQTDADAAVYYALSYANNSLAISYYKELRGVPPSEAQKNQFDSMICAMESKFALMKGVLVPGGSCSVFRRIEAKTPAKPQAPEN
jgi:hypothetical protein